MFVRFSRFFSLASLAHSPLFGHDTHLNESHIRDVRVCVCGVSFFAFVFLCKFVCCVFFFAALPTAHIYCYRFTYFSKKLRFLFWPVTFYELSHKISSMAKSSLQINEFLIAYLYSLLRLSCNQREVFVYSYSFLHINLLFFRTSSSIHRTMLPAQYHFFLCGHSFVVSVFLVCAFIANRKFFTLKNVLG